MICISCTCLYVYIVSECWYILGRLAKKKTKKKRKTNSKKCFGLSSNTVSYMSTVKWNSPPWSSRATKVQIPASLLWFGVVYLLMCVVNLIVDVVHMMILLMLLMWRKLCGNGYLFSLYQVLVFSVIFRILQLNTVREKVAIDSRLSFISNAETAFIPSSYIPHLP